MATPVPGDVFACMEELGIDNMRQVDDEISGKCPMHYDRIGKEDRHSSWSVHADDGMFNCFSCGYKGPFVLLVKDMLKIDWADAVLWIRARGSIERIKRQLGYGYVEELKHGPIDTSKQYNEASLALFVDPPNSALDERNLSLESVQHYGILWNPERDTWIAPIRDPYTDELRGWQEKNDRYFRNRPRDVKKSECLFGLDVFEGGWMLVVESPLDAPRIDTAGIAGGVSTFGAAVSDHQFDLIIGNADGVIWAQDADKAGDQSSEMLRLKCAQWGFPSKFLNYSHTPRDVKDPGEMTDEEIQEAVETAFSGVVARFAKR
jgi:DNA primase